MQELTVSSLLLFFFNKMQKKQQQQVEQQPTPTSHDKTKAVSLLV